MITKHDKEQAERYVRGEDASDTPRADKAFKVMLKASQALHVPVPVSVADSYAGIFAKLMEDVRVIERELTAARAHLADANKGARINALVNQELVKKNMELQAELAQLKGTT